MNTIDGILCTEETKCSSKRKPYKIISNTK